jgi:hypothetical protein
MGSRNFPSRKGVFPLDRGISIHAKQSARWIEELPFTQPALPIGSRNFHSHNRLRQKDRGISVHTKASSRWIEEFPFTQKAPQIGKGRCWRGKMPRNSFGAAVLSKLPPEKQFIRILCGKTADSLGSPSLQLIDSVFQGEYAVCGLTAAGYDGKTMRPGWETPLASIVRRSCPQNLLF